MRRRLLLFVALALPALPVIALALMLASCDSTPKPDTEQHVFGACYRSYAATLNAWTDKNGRPPDECLKLDRDYTIQLAPESDIPCAIDEGSVHAENAITTGCTQIEELTIYLLEGRAESQLVDSSVHEWVHALANCADGDPDRLHLRAELWEGYGTDTVEVRALTDDAFVIGECAVLEGHSLLRHSWLLVAAPLPDRRRRSVPS